MPPACASVIWSACCLLKKKKRKTTCKAGIGFCVGSCSYVGLWSICKRQVCFLCLCLVDVDTHYCTYEQVYVSDTHVCMFYISL